MPEATTAPVVTKTSFSHLLGLTDAGALVRLPASEIPSGSGGSYTLPPATGSVLGGVKVGSGLAVAGDGTLSVSYSYSLPPATAATLGGVKVGSGLAVAGDGTLSTTYTYTLPPATSGAIGGVKPGSGLSVAADGTLAVTYTYSLPAATSSVRGGVKIGAGLSVASDVVSTVQATTLNRGTAGSTIDFNMYAAIGHRVKINAATTFTLSGWSADGTLSELLLVIENGATGYITWPTDLRWCKADGTETTDFYQTGITLQTAGFDLVSIVSFDGGATKFARVCR